MLCYNWSTVSNSLIFIRVIIIVPCFSSILKELWNEITVNGINSFKHETLKRTSLLFIYHRVSVLKSSDTNCNIAS